MSTITRENQMYTEDPKDEQHMLSVPDETGDVRHMWDPRNKAEVAVAKAAFDEAKRKGMTAYAVDNETGERTRTVITEFDKKLGKIVMVPALAGG